MAAYEDTRDGVLLTDDPAKIDLDAVCDLVELQDWGAPRRIVRTAFEHSHPYVLLEDGRLVGCMRLVTDTVMFAYVDHVIVAESHRGRGLGAWMLGSVMARPEYAEMHRWMLLTENAHDFYRTLGFDDFSRPSYAMDIRVPCPKE